MISAIVVGGVLVGSVKSYSSEYSITQVLSSDSKKSGSDLTAPSANGAFKFCTIF